jgi:hypothetical protein
MSERKWERATGIASILTVVVLLAELVTWTNPAFADPMSKIRGYFAGNPRLASASLELAVMGILPLLVFAGGLRMVFRRLEGDAAVLSAIFFASATAFASTQLVFAAVSGALVLTSAGATDGEVKVLLGALNFLDATRFMPFAMMVGAAGVAMVTTGGFQRWIGWVGVVSGALGLVGEVSLLDFNGPISSLGNAAQGSFYLYMVWGIAVGLTLIRRPVASAPLTAVQAAKQPVAV